jgi:hypothetical protein
LFNVLLTGLVGAIELGYISFIILDLYGAKVFRSSLLYFRIKLNSIATLRLITVAIIVIGDLYRIYSYGRY